VSVALAPIIAAMTGSDRFTLGELRYRVGGIAPVGQSSSSAPGMAA